MGILQREAVGENPSTSEEKPTSRGFRVKVENPNLILNAIQERRWGRFCIYLLEKPAAQVNAEFAPEEKNDSFNLTKLIKWPSFINPSPQSEEIRKAVEQRFRSTPLGQNLYKIIQSEIVGFFYT